MKFEDMNTCAWCHKNILADSEVFGLGAKLRPEIDFMDKEGEIISLYLTIIDREIPAVVTVSGSDAKKDGNDVMFMICCEECGEALKEVLQTEIDFFENISFT